MIQLYPIFEHLPVGNIVFQNQQQYYEAIKQSTNAIDSGVFIDFMLDKILATLKNRQGETSITENNVGEKNISDKILIMVEQNPGMNANEIAASIPDKTKRTIESQIAKLKEAEWILTSKINLNMKY